MASFKEEYPRLQALGAEVLAISADSLQSHRRFAEKLGGVPFPMLSDEGAVVITRYGVLNERGTGARRSVFVLDKDLRILHANTQFGASNPLHYRQVVEALEL